MRNRYLDLLRAAAIVRVIVYHLFGWPWLSMVLPAMGIMFALAGSLTATSLDKRADRYRARLTMLRDTDDDDVTWTPEFEAGVRARLAVIDAQRDELLRWRDSGRLTRPVARRRSGRPKPPRTRTGG